MAMQTLVQNSSERRKIAFVSLCILVAGVVAGICYSALSMIALLATGVFVLLLVIRGKRNYIRLDDCKRLIEIRSGFGFFRVQVDSLFSLQRQSLEGGETSLQFFDANGRGYPLPDVDFPEADFTPLHTGLIRWLQKLGYSCEIRRDIFDPQLSCWMIKRKE